jgi:hypothetical protein
LFAACSSSTVASVRAQAGKLAALMLLVVLALAVPTSASASGHRPDRRSRGRPERVSDRAKNLNAHASIIGGVEVSNGSYPWLAFIVRDSGGAIFQCTGTVIAPNVVLTAGHCGEDTETGGIDNAADYAVVTGNVDWTGSPRQVSGVSRVVVYPGFSRALLTGDAALLILSTPTTAPSISLASYPEDAAHLQAGAGGIIAGWGATFPGEEGFTERLRAAETVVQGSAYCANNSPPFYSSFEICTINAPDDDTGACHGDSGGPLIALNPIVELGVISHGEEECSTEDPTVYTRADLIRSWANQQIAVANPPPAPPPVLPVPPAPPASPPAAAIAAPTPAAIPPNAPGLYVTRPSRTRNVRIRVSGDGTHIVGLHIKMPVPCQNGYSLPLSTSYLSYGDTVGISNHVARATLEVPADRETRRGSIDLHVHFTTTGSLEATLRVRVAFRTSRVGLCAGTLRFGAKI